MGDVRFLLDLSLKTHTHTHTRTRTQYKAMGGCSTITLTTRRMLEFSGTLFLDDGRILLCVVCVVFFFPQNEFAGSARRSLSAVPSQLSKFPRASLVAHSRSPT